MKPNQLSSPASLMLRCNTATTAEAKQELSKGHPELAGKCLQRETSSRSCKTVFPPISSLTKNTHICNLVGKHPSRAAAFLLFKFSSIVHPPNNTNVLTKKSQYTEITAPIFAHEIPCRCSCSSIFKVNTQACSAFIIATAARGQDTG